MNRRLHRSQEERVISGVAGGVAEYLDADPSIVRAVWAVLAIFTAGVFFALYLVLWIVLPLGPDGGAPAADGSDSAGQSADWATPRTYRAQRGSGSGSWFFGLILIGLGIWFLAREYLPGVDLDRLWPPGLVVLGLVVLVVAFRRRAS